MRECKEALERVCMFGTESAGEQKENDDDEQRAAVPSETVLDLQRCNEAKRE